MKKDTALFSCELCPKKYKTEAGFIRHKCRGKIRLEETRSASGRIGFAAFKQFFHSMQSINAKQKTIKDFINSQYYNGFMKYGKYIVDNRITLHQEYTRYLTTYNIAMDKWCSDAVYAVYIKSITKKETMEKAIEKSLKTMEAWSLETKKPWNLYFKEESKYKIIHHLKMGKISPWVLYNSASGSEFFSKLTKGDLDEIFEYVDPGFWDTKFKRFNAHTLAIKTTLNSVGL